MSTLQPRFDQSAAEYHKVAIQQRAVCAQLWDMAAVHVGAEDQVLDVGCGDGVLASLSHHPQLLGIDHSHAMCKQAGKRMAVMQSDMHHLPLDDDSCDVWFSSLAIQWSTHPAYVIQEALRVLRPGGILACSSYVDGTLGQLHDSMRAVDYPVNRFLSVTEWESIFIGNNLQMVEQDVVEEKSQYQGVLDLLQYLKSIGANRYYPENQPVMSLKQLRALQKHYPIESEHINTQWRVGLWVLEAPS